MTKRIAPFIALACWGLSAAAWAQALAPLPGTSSPRVLATVVLGDASRSMAMVSVDGAASQTVRVGHTLAGGYRVSAIERDRLLLERDGQLHALPVQAPVSGAQAPTLAPRTPAPTPVAPTAAGLLQAQDIGALRAACADSALMASLPAAQRAELATVGLCPQR